MSDASDYDDDPLDSPMGAGSSRGGEHDSDNKRHARIQHNALERRRRDNIKDMYSSLKDTVPDMHNERQASRAMILRKAIETIKDKQDAEQQLTREITDLERENEAIEEEIRQLQQREDQEREMARALKKYVGHDGVVPEGKE